MQKNNVAIACNSALYSTTRGDDGFVDSQALLALPCLLRGMHMRGPCWSARCPTSTEL